MKKRDNKFSDSKSKSKEKTKIKCPDCGFEEYITIVDFIKRKF